MKWKLNKNFNYLLKFVFFNFLSTLFSGINQVTLLGRVGGEPQKRGNDNHPVVTFSVATHTNYKYDDGLYFFLIFLFFPGN